MYLSSSRKEEGRERCLYLLPNLCSIQKPLNEVTAAVVHASSVDYSGVTCLGYDIVDGRTGKKPYSDVSVKQQILCFGIGKAAFHP